MTSTVATPVWPISVVTIDTGNMSVRGRESEFRHHGIVLRRHSSGASALLDLGREPGSVVLVPSDLSDIPFLKFVELAVSLAHAHVIIGLIPGTTVDIVRSCLERSPHGIVELPVTPGRLALSVADIAPPEPLEPEILICGPLELDHSRHRVLLDNQEVPLALKEFNVLAYLMSASPRTVPAAELVNATTSGDTDHAMPAQVAIGRLRAKFARTGPHVPPMIETIRGVGYRMSPECSMPISSINERTRSTISSRITRISAGDLPTGSSNIQSM